VIALLIVLLVAAQMLRAILKRHRGALLTVPLLSLLNLLGLSALGIVAGASRSPIVTLGNLMGGITLLCLTWWFYLATRPTQPANPTPHRTRLPWLICGLILTAVAVLLGTLTSANYAALACSGLPDCDGMWWPSSALGEALDLLRPLTIDDRGIIVSDAAQQAVQLAHRIGAFAGVVWGILFIGRTLLHRARPPAWDLSVVLLLIVQYAMGAGLVLNPASLTFALAHNLGSSLLLVALLGTIHHHLPRRTTAS